MFVVVVAGECLFLGLMALLVKKKRVVSFILCVYMCLLFVFPRHNFILSSCPSLSTS